MGERRNHYSSSLSSCNQRCVSQHQDVMEISGNKYETRQFALTPPWPMDIDGLSVREILGRFSGQLSSD